MRLCYATASRRCPRARPAAPRVRARCNIYGTLQRARARSGQQAAAGIDAVQFLGNGDIVGMVSREGEVVPLRTRVKPSLSDGAVEKWLVQVPTLQCARTGAGLVRNCLRCMSPRLELAGSGWR